MNLPTQGKSYFLKNVLGVFIRVNPLLFDNDVWIVPQINDVFLLLFL